MANFFQGIQPLSHLFGSGQGLNGLIVPSLNSNQNRTPLGLFSSGSNNASLGLNLPKLGVNNGGSNGAGVGLLRNLDENLRESEKDRKKEKDQDKLELGNFSERAAQQALENARRMPRIGATNEIVVSEDGRFEASVDIRFKSDGSYELDLAVRFAESSAASLKSMAALGAPKEGEFETQDKRNQFSYSGMQAYAERYTSFEQILQTRGFEARIFFEESKAIGFRAEEAHGDGVGKRMTSVASQMAHEYTLNVSIRGDNLNDFNDIANTLSQFDDTGTLNGFLEAARGVLTGDSSNIDSFLGATRGLLNASRDHVGAKLSQFFSSIDKDFGSDLEKLGFGSDFFSKMGESVQNDLNRFFNVTNEMFGKLLGDMKIGRNNDAQTKQLDVIKENLEALREKRQERQDQIKEERNETPELSGQRPGGNPIFNELV